MHCLWPSCGREFKQTEILNLHKHVKQHLGYYEHKCSCGEQFVADADLSSHVHAMKNNRNGVTHIPFFGHSNSPYLSALASVIVGDTTDMTVGGVTVDKVTNRMHHWLTVRPSLVDNTVPRDREPRHSEKKDIEEKREVRPADTKQSSVERREVRQTGSVERNGEKRSDRRETEDRHHGERREYTRQREGDRHADTRQREGDRHADTRQREGDRHADVRRDQERHGRREDRSGERREHRGYGYGDRREGDWGEGRHRGWREQESRREHGEERSHHIPRVDRGNEPYGHGSRRFETPHGGVKYHVNSGDPRRYTGREYPAREHRAGEEQRNERDPVGANPVGRGQPGSSLRSTSWRSDTTVRSTDPGKVMSNEKEKEKNTVMGGRVRSNSHIIFDDDADVDLVGPPPPGNQGESVQKSETHTTEQRESVDTGRTQTTKQRETVREEETQTQSKTANKRRKVSSSSSASATEDDEDTVEVTHVTNQKDKRQKGEKEDNHIPVVDLDDESNEEDIEKEKRAERRGGEEETRQIAPHNTPSEAALLCPVSVENLPPPFVSTSTIRCRIRNCKMLIKDTFRDRYEHVACHHMTAQADEDWREVLGGELRKAFPGLHWDENSCTLCSKKVMTQSSRRNHCRDEHCSAYLLCRLTPTCAFMTAKVNEFGVHMNKEHGIDNAYSLGKGKLVFDGCKRKLNVAITDILARCYPVPPLSKHRLAELTTRRRSCDGSVSPTTTAIAAIINDQSTLGSQLKKPKQKRLKPSWRPCSSSSESSEGEAVQAEDDVQIIESTSEDFYVDRNGTRDNEERRDADVETTRDNAEMRVADLQTTREKRTRRGNRSTRNSGSEGGLEKQTENIEGEEVPKKMVKLEPVNFPSTLLPADTSADTLFSEGFVKREVENGGIPHESGATLITTSTTTTRVPLLNNLPK